MSERQERSFTMGQAMRRQRAKDKRERRMWTLRQGGHDLDAIAEAHGLRLRRIGRGLSIAIQKGEWIAAHFWPATETLVFDGGQAYHAKNLEDAIGKVASVLKLD